MDLKTGYPKLPLIIILLLSLTSFSTNNIAAPKIWDKLTFKAQKFGLSAHATVQLATLPTESLAMQLVWPQNHSGLSTTQAELSRLELSASFAGRKIHYTTLLELGSGKVLQSIRERRDEKKIYRFTKEGVLQIKDKQGQQHSKLVSLPLQNEPPLTQPIYLFYFISASEHLQHIGDRIDIAVYSNKSIHTITLSVIDELRYATRYTLNQETPSDKNRHVPALKITVTSPSAVELAGLKGSLTFYLEKNTRLPLELQGSIELIGRIRYILQTARLAIMEN